jgi:hypothetical protein
MAQLMSEEQESPSMLVLSPGPAKKQDEQDWQHVTIDLISGRRDLHTLENEDSLFCRKPTDEVADLVANLQRLLANDVSEVIFEPSEPSFELSFIRTRRGGIKVEAWLDAGNGITGICTWDASGIRFYTNDDMLRQFAADLVEEFDLKSKVGT